MKKAGGRGCRDVGREIIGRNAGDKEIEGKKKKKKKKKKGTERNKRWPGGRDET